MYLCPVNWNRQCFVLIHDLSQDCVVEGSGDLRFARQPNGRGLTFHFQMYGKAICNILQPQIISSRSTFFKENYIKAFKLILCQFVLSEPGRSKRMGISGVSFAVQVDLCTNNCLFRAAVPSGASTGIYEAPGRTTPTWN